MALFVHNIGVFAKLFSEAVEQVDPRPVEGIRVTGAVRVQEVIFGVIPQVMPLWSSFTLYRLETNVRSATTLGIVGAGGIGQTLYESIRSFHYADTAAQIYRQSLTAIVMDRPLPARSCEASRLAQRPSSPWTRTSKRARAREVLFDRCQPVDCDLFVRRARDRTYRRQRGENLPLAPPPTPGPVEGHVKPRNPRRRLDSPSDRRLWTLTPLRRRNRAALPVYRVPSSVRAKRRPKVLVHAFAQGVRRRRGFARRGIAMKIAQRADARLEPQLPMAALWPS